MLSLSPLLISLQMLSRRVWGLFAAGNASSVVMLVATVLYAFRVRESIVPSRVAEEGTARSLKEYELRALLSSPPNVSPSNNEADNADEVPAAETSGHIRHPTASSNPATDGGGGGLGGQRRSWADFLDPFASGGLSPSSTGRQRRMMTTKKRKPVVPLLSENIDPKSEGVLAARTHDVGPPHHLPPLAISTATSSHQTAPSVDAADVDASALLYPPLLTNPPSMVWLPYDALSAEEARDSERFWHLRATYDEAVPLEALRRRRRRHLSEPSAPARSRAPPSLSLEQHELEPLEMRTT
jgi:hypothetical protein